MIKPGTLIQVVEVVGEAPSVVEFQSEPFGDLFYYIPDSILLFVETTPSHDTLWKYNHYFLDENGEKVFMCSDDPIEEEIKIWFKIL